MVSADGLATEKLEYLRQRAIGRTIQYSYRPLEIKAAHIALGDFCAAYLFQFKMRKLEAKA